MAKERVPAQNLPRSSNGLKTAWRKKGRKDGQSLKTFARALATQRDELATNWLHNKTANTSKPNKGIGRTRKKKTKGGGGNASTKPTKG